MKINKISRNDSYVWKSLCRSQTELIIADNLLPRTLFSNGGGSHIQLLASHLAIKWQGMVVLRVWTSLQGFPLPITREEESVALKTQFKEASNSSVCESNPIAQATSSPNLDEGWSSAIWSLFKFLTTSHLEYFPVFLYTRFVLTNWP